MTGDVDEVGFVGDLRRLKDGTGRSVRSLAVAARVPPSTLGGYFSGRHLPEDADAFGRLLQVLGVDDEAQIVCWQERARHLARRRRRAGGDQIGS